MPVLVNIAFVQIFITLIPKLRTIRLKAKLVARGGWGESSLTSCNMWYHSSLQKTKQKNLAAHKKSYKTFQYSFFPSIKNQTKIKCSTHKSVKKIAKFFLSCNKIALGLSSLNQIIQCPSFWVHHLLYVPLNLNCREL